MERGKKCPSATDWRTQAREVSTGNLVQKLSWKSQSWLQPAKIDAWGEN